MDKSIKLEFSFDEWEMIRNALISGMRTAIPYKYMKGLASSYRKIDHKIAKQIYKGRKILNGRLID